MHFYFLITTIQPILWKIYTIIVILHALKIKHFLKPSYLTEWKSNISTNRQLSCITDGKINLNSYKNNKRPSWKTRSNKKTKQNRKIYLQKKIITAQKKRDVQKQPRASCLMKNLFKPLINVDKGERWNIVDNGDT